MILNFVLNAIEFVETNAILVAVVMAIMGYIKQTLSQYLQGWKLTLTAFVISFIFAIPEGGIVDPAQFAFNGFLLGLVATGVYKTGQNIVRK